VRHGGGPRSHRRFFSPGIHHGRSQQHIFYAGGSLTTCLQVGRAPAGWQRALVTPVPKPGCNPALLTSYRPIAVGSVLPKIYARTLNARLVGWAEKNNKHAPEQAGFRPGMNTENHLFHLRHVWDVSQQPGAAPMYLAFVDLKQAYDRVSRPLLWTALDFIGVQGAFLAAIQSLYLDVQMVVRLPSGLIPYLICSCGLRQGCSLSPTLITLYHI